MGRTTVTMVTKIAGFAFSLSLFTTKSPVRTPREKHGVGSLLDLLFAPLPNVNISNNSLSCFSVLHVCLAGLLRAGDSEGPKLCRAQVLLPTTVVMKRVEQMGQKRKPDCGRPPTTLV